jgi:hypothetical protein
MANHANATQNTRIYDKFEYFLEDIDCAYCANFLNRGGHGCGRTKCEFQSLRDECISNGRIKRKKRWDKGCRE